MAVTDVEAHVADRHLDRIGESGLARRVGVAVDGMHRSDQLQLVEDVVAPDVAGVEDQFDAGERRVHVGPNESMRIRDQSNKMRARASHSDSSLPHRAARRCGTPRWSSTRATTKFTRSSTLAGR